MLCGKMNSSGKKFSFTIKNAQLQNLKNHFFYVEGISNSNSTHSFIQQSGVFSVKKFLIGTPQDPAPGTSDKK